MMINKVIGFVCVSVLLLSALLMVQYDHLIQENKNLKELLLDNELKREVLARQNTDINNQNIQLQEDVAIAKISQKTCNSTAHELREALANKTEALANKTRENWVLDLNVESIILQVDDCDIDNNMTAWGYYKPGTGTIHLRTNGRTNEDVCSTFLHELGHHVDSFRSRKTDGEKEEFANDFEDANQWRCEGL